METTHHHVVGDSRSMDALADDSVELVVTSPPYPMIEMWDEAFAAMDPAVSDHLDAGRGETAFEAMHACLDETWAEVERVLVEGGIACVTVGDATRTLDRFARYPNAARVTRWFTGAGFDALPEVVWRKPTNSAAKFMGSGMVPPNAYVTLEHEHVLVFRNGGGRTFPPGDDARYEAAYFWEERNRWFSDLWTDVGGALQDLDDDDLRDRTAAFPIEVPYRLINMYSVYGDTVLDPFWGTGTTSLAAMVAARDSVGYERDSGFVDVFAERAADAPALSRSVGRRRLADHEAFVERREQAPGYEATHYDVAVVSKQERDIRLYAVESVRRDGDTHVATHAPLDS